MVRFLLARAVAALATAFFAATTLVAVRAIVPLTEARVFRIVLRAPCDRSSLTVVTFSETLLVFLTFLGVPALAFFTGASSLSAVLLVVSGALAVLLGEAGAGRKPSGAELRPALRGADILLVAIAVSPPRAWHIAKRVHLSISIIEKKPR